MAFEIDRDQLNFGETSGIRIKVVGIGRFGCAAVNQMVHKSITGVDYVAMHSDPQALLDSKAPLRLSIGGSPAFRGKINEEERRHIASQLHGANVIILIAGMGKGTGTYLAPGVALVARNMGILTLGIVTTPFSCEGKAKARSAEDGIAALKKYVDTLVVVDNEKLLVQSADKTTVDEAFVLTSALVLDSVKGIAEVLTSNGHINISFADFSELLANAGEASIGMATASGEGSAQKAVMNAFKSLQIAPDAAGRINGVMVNISGKVAMKDLTMAMNYLQERVGADANIINGYIDHSPEPGVTRAMLIVTGVRQAPKGASPQPPENKPQGWPISLPGITNKGIKPPAYLQQQMRIEGQQGSLSPQSSSFACGDRINKSSPGTPAFERLITE
jgi:cell division protein FtsZ